MPCIVWLLIPGAIFDLMFLGSINHAAIKCGYTYIKTYACNPHCLDFSKIPTTVSQKYTDQYINTCKKETMYQNIMFFNYDLFTTKTSDLY